MATVSIVGGETLLGREIDDRVKQAKLASVVQLIGAGDSTGVLTEIEGEPTVLTGLDADRLKGSEIVFCAGDAGSTRRALELAGASAVFVDLTAALEDLPQARLRSPLSEQGEAPPGTGRIHVIAHPAATALATVLGRIHGTFPIRHSVVQVLEPASERGQAGINELQQQVASLLSFRPLEKRVFDAQAAFSVLPRYGDEAPERLQDVEARIHRHLASLLRGVVPIPSLRLTQAPVFHGYSMSLWIEFESRPAVRGLAEALASADVEVRDEDVEAPTNVGVAGQAGVSVGLIEPDVNHPRAMWVWAVADNLRLAADNAVDVARAVLGSASH